MAHVYISYKHEDGDFADILKSKLIEAGFTLGNAERLTEALDELRVTADGTEELNENTLTNAYEQYVGSFDGNLYALAPSGDDRAAATR